MKTVTFDETQWALVPRQADEAMRQAAQLAIVDARGRLYDDFQDVWSEILAVSPTLEAEQHVPAPAAAGRKRGVPAQPPETHPSLRKGDWVASRVDPGQFSSHIQLAKVKDVYRDPVDPLKGRWLMDLVFYARDGAKLGRVSPAMGGPRGFEPACTASLWAKIAEPDFEVLTKRQYGSIYDLLTWLDEGSAL